MAKVLSWDEVQDRISKNETPVFVEFVKGVFVLSGPLQSLVKEGGGIVFHLKWCAERDVPDPDSRWKNCCVVTYSFDEDSVTLHEKERNRIFLKMSHGGATIYLNGSGAPDPREVEGIDPRFLEHQG